MKSRTVPPKIPFKDKLRQLNALGLLALLPGVVCLCLALQWGGTTYAWSEGRIITLLVLASVLLIAFALIQVWKPEQATLPPRISSQRSIASGFWVSSCLGAHMMVFVYYLPIRFQAIEGISAVDNGIHLLPMVMPIIVVSIITGQLVSRIGYYTLFMIFGVCLTAVGATLLTTLKIDTSEGKWIGFQVGLITVCLSVLGTLGMGWRSIKKNLPPKNPDGEWAAEEGKNRDVAAAVLKVSTEATRTASQIDMAYTLMLNTVEKTEEKTEQKTKERTETEKADAKDMVA